MLSDNLVRKGRKLGWLRCARILRRGQGVRTRFVKWNEAED